MKPQILVPLHVYPSGNAPSVAGHVAAVARHLGADVHAMIVDPTFPQVSSIMGDMILDVSALADSVMAQCLAHGLDLTRALEEALGPQGTALRVTELDSILGIVDSKALAHARCSDLTVIGIGATDTAPQLTAETVVFGAGRPVLLVPEDETPSAYRHALIAWDGSRVAARAVADALGFLGRADKVTIVSVTDDKPMPDGAGQPLLTQYLSHHDIRAEFAQIRKEGRPVASALQDHAMAYRGDLIVMGAFGHSRLRDFVLGGATAGVLRDLRVPVLLSH